jgi:hypothetical protein
MIGITKYYSGDEMKKRWARHVARIGTREVYTGF